MDDDNTVNPAQESAASTPPDFDAFLASGGQAEFERRVQAQIDAAKQRWSAEQEAALTEEEKLKKMSATERERYQLSKDREALDAQKAAFEHEKLVVAVGDEMQKRGLPAALAKYLTGKDAAESMETLTAFEADFHAAVQAQVNGTMRGSNIPKDANKTTGNYTRESVQKMTAAEINAHWNEISAAMKGW